MTWERALEADARLAAKNAVLIRAALRQSFDAERAFTGYANTMPDESLTLPQQRVRARAWAIMNIRPNLEPLRQVLIKIWAEAYALGDTAAREAIEEAKQARKADVQGTVDWSKWKPGDAAQAIILKPPRAFQQLLQQAGITLKGFSDTTLTDIGNSIGEAIELGLDAKRSAKTIMTHVASPARALTIAITEQNRAISAATVNRYREAGLQQQEWLVFEPCVKCAQNANKKVNIGAPFPSGDTQPPAHPNCRCALAPVIPGFDEETVLPGVGTVTPPPVPTPAESPIPARVIEPSVIAATYAPGKWVKLSQEEKVNEWIRITMQKYPRMAEEYLRASIANEFLSKADLDYLKKGEVYKNGSFAVQFSSVGLKVPEATRKKLFAEIDALQKVAPKEGITFIISSNRGTAYGSAILGDAKVWLKPSLVMDDVPKKAELGFKMPAIGIVPHRQYTLAHEWGHTQDIGGSFGRGESIQNAATEAIILELKRKYANDPFAYVSDYAKKNTKEFYAEMFAEWTIMQGQTKNPLLKELAERLGWYKFAEVPKTLPPQTVGTEILEEITEQNAVPVPAYVAAKTSTDYFTPEISNDFYSKKATGEVDYQSFNRDGQNLYLKNILQLQGFNGKPTVVSATEFQKYVKQGATPIYRGVSGTKKAQPAAYIQQYLNGDDPFIGKGMFGDGTYFGSTRDIAESFAKTNIKGEKLRYGAVIDAVLNPQAKVINLADISKMAEQIFKGKKYEFAQDFYDDSSAVAAALGYDAIKIPTPVLKWGEKPIGSDYYIVLNRTAVIVKEMP